MCTRTPACIAPRPDWWRLVLILLLAFAGAGAANAETFDLMRFNAPAGTRVERADALTFADSTPTIFTTYGIYRATRSSGDPARDFADEWQATVANRLRVTGELKTETVDWPGGWKMTMGAAKVWSEGSRNFVSLLSVFTGYGVKITAVVEYNDDVSRPKIDAFLASLQPQVPAGQGTTVATGSDAGAPELTSQEWYHSVANYSHWGTYFNRSQIAAINNQGSARWYYRFQPDGSYTFTSEFWSMSKSQDYWFVEESGTWSRAGDVLSLRPTRAQRLLRDRDGRAQGAAQAVALEPASYRYAFQYLSGMQRWYLVLMPVSGQDTNRDGSRSTIPDYGLAYRYGPRPRCEQRPRPSDCRG